MNTPIIISNNRSEQFTPCRYFGTLAPSTKASENTTEYAWVKQRKKYPPCCSQSFTVVFRD